MERLRLVLLLALVSQALCLPPVVRRVLQSDRPIPAYLLEVAATAQNETHIGVIQHGATLAQSSSHCPATENGLSCCQQKSCPLSKAICCPTGNHCCPVGTRCTYTYPGSPMMCATEPQRKLPPKVSNSLSPHPLDSRLSDLSPLTEDEKSAKLKKDQEVEESQCKCASAVQHCDCAKKTDPSIPTQEIVVQYEGVAGTQDDVRSG